MFGRAAAFVAAYAGWLAAVAVSGLLNLTEHTVLAFLPAIAVLVGTGLGASAAADRWGRRPVDQPPLSRRPGVLVAVLGGLAFAAAGFAGDVYSGVVGRDAEGVVLRTGCAQVAENGGGCAPICEVGRVGDGRSLGWMTCGGSGGQVGDRTTVRIDPHGFAVARQAEDSYAPATAKVLTGLGLAGAGLAAVLLFDAICRVPARDAQARAARQQEARQQEDAERQAGESA